MKQQLEDVVRGLDAKTTFLMSQYSQLLAVNSVFQSDLALSKASIQALEADRYLLLNRLAVLENSNALLTNVRNRFLSVFKRLTQTFYKHYMELTLQSSQLLVSQQIIHSKLVKLICINR
jgi:hypothetical protein